MSAGGSDILNSRGLHGRVWSDFSRETCSQVDALTLPSEILFMSKVFLFKVF